MEPKDPEHGNGSQAHSRMVALVCKKARPGFGNGKHRWPRFARDSAIPRPPQGSMVGGGYKRYQKQSSRAAHTRGPGPINETQQLRPPLSPARARVGSDTFSCFWPHDEFRNGRTLPHPPNTHAISQVTTLVRVESNLVTVFVTKVSLFAIGPPPLCIARSVIRSPPPRRGAFKPHPGGKRPP